MKGLSPQKCKATGLLTKGDPILGLPGCPAPWAPAPTGSPRGPKATRSRPPRSVCPRHPANTLPRLRRGAAGGGGSQASCQKAGGLLWTAIPTAPLLALPEGRHGAARATRAPRASPRLGLAALTRPRRLTLTRSSMLTLPSLFSSSAETKLMSLFSGMCLICFMALMSSVTLMTVSLGGHSLHVAQTYPSLARPPTGQLDPGNFSLPPGPLAPAFGNARPTRTQNQKPSVSPRSPCVRGPPVSPASPLVMGTGSPVVTRTRSLRPARAVVRVGPPCTVGHPGKGH